MENLVKTADLKGLKHELLSSKQFYCWFGLFVVWSLVLMYVFGYLHLIDNPWYLRGFYEPFLFFIPILVYRPIRTWMKQQWGFRKILELRFYVVFILGLIVLLLVHYFFYYGMINHAIYYLNGLSEFFLAKTQHDNAAIYQAWSVILFGSVIAPICEEVFFRGILMNFLIKKYNLGIGLVISSTLFAVGHFEFGITRLAALAATGVILGLVTHYTKSIIPAIIIHGIWNFISIVLLAHVISVYQLF
ncbi:CPBP family intramembrane metalloprotease [Virgibacillus siamensis]|uniref:CPBP family intramembrane metalloprotease n=1 Tax=Virgibacillus siamensis TaxID=480071 RepID=A0ABP3R6W1_9BACI